MYFCRWSAWKSLLHGRWLDAPGPDGHPHGVLLSPVAHVDGTLAPDGVRLDSLVDETADDLVLE